MWTELISLGDRNQLSSTKFIDSEFLHLSCNFKNNTSGCVGQKVENPFGSKVRFFYVFFVKYRNSPIFSTISDDAKIGLCDTDS